MLESCKITLTKYKAQLSYEQASRSPWSHIPHMSDKLTYLPWSSIPTDMAAIVCGEIPVGLWHWAKKVVFFRVPQMIPTY